MGGVERGDHDAVDLGIGDQLVRVAERTAAALAGGCLRAVGIGVGDRRDAGAVDRRGERPHVVGAHHPGADHADADCLDRAHTAVGKCMCPRWCEASFASSGQRLVTTLPRV